MSSRVQKGGTLFRPVTKQRRSASESPLKPGPAASVPLQWSETPNSMPPPSSVPQRLETPALSSTSEQQDTDESPTRRSPIEPQRTQLPNVLSSRMSTPIAIGSSRKPATPTSVGSHSSSIPVTPTPTPRAISVPSRSAPSRPPSDTHPRAMPPLENADNDETRRLHTPPPDPPPVSTPSKKRPVSAVEPEYTPANSPSKKARAHRQTTTKSTPRKEASQGVPASEPEWSPGPTPGTVEDAEAGATPRSSPKHRRKRSPIPYDPEQPGIELDPTVVTMASICVDTGQGRVSSKANEIMKNHVVWKAANRERRAQMIAEMEAKKYGKALDGENAPNTPPSTPANPPNPQAVVDGSVPMSEPTAGENEFDYSQVMSTSKFNVQVRIGPNGETVVNEESLYVDNSAEQDTHDYTHVEESDTTKFVNSSTHSKKLRGSRWSAMETELFYDALSQFGENYELISYVLPGRDRKACKNKFKAEDRRDPTRINQSLKNRTPYDIQTLARMTGKDFSGPVPVIKAPTPLRMVDDDVPTQQRKEETLTVRKKSRTPGVQPTNQVEEVLGDVDDYEDKD